MNSGTNHCESKRERANTTSYRMFSSDKQSWDRTDSTVESFQNNTDDYDFEVANMEDSDSDEDTMEMLSTEPWKTLLLAPARAAWRVTDPHPPNSLIQAHNAVLANGERTSKQLKMTYSKILESHKRLATKREQERRRLVNSRHRDDTESSSSSKQDERVYYGHNQTLASLRYRLYPNYVIAKRVLGLPD